MDTLERKKVTVITKYALESFSEGDWYTLGQITGKLKVINDHPRLLRSMGFGDDDYEYCVAEVLDTIFAQDSSLISNVIDHFDIDLWYQQKDLEKYRRVFLDSTISSADFWTDGYLKLFVSHLSSNKVRMSAMKASLAKWGISAFIAHEDIEPSRKWMDEVETGLETMEVMVAVVEPGFRDSEWCDQEVGFALGRKIDIIPLRAGLDPYGFFGKFQGIQIKGKYPEDVSNEITQLLLKKPKHRSRLLQSMSKAFTMLQSEQKIKMIEVLDSWSVTTDEQIKVLLEASSLSEYERHQLKNLIARVEAFKVTVQTEVPPDDDIPF
ncbi:MAG: TIR domain-containing protein [Desulfobacula sp.]|nr:TIR domain-containing protein [Desulfobacula sp.]